MSKVKVQGREWPVGKLPFQINWEVLHVKSEYHMGIGIDGHWWHRSDDSKPSPKFNGIILTKWAEDNRQSESYMLGKCFPVCFFLEVEGNHKMVKCCFGRSDILFLE